MDVVLSKKDNLFQASIIDIPDSQPGVGPTPEVAVAHLMYQIITKTRNNAKYIYDISIRDWAIQFDTKYEPPIESRPRSYFNIYKDEEFPVDGNQRLKILISYGCDGTNHAISIDLVDYDKNCNVVFARNLINTMIGPCDKSCGTKGFFSI